MLRRLGTEMSDYYDKLTFIEKAKHHELTTRLESVSRQIVKLSHERYELLRRLESQRKEAQRLGSHIQVLEKTAARRPFPPKGDDAA
jgi:chromosome segregation ATPase